MPNPRALSLEQATARLRELSQEFAVIPNHGVTFPPHDVVPLSACHAHADGPLRAVLMDMDGTTTLTEDLCLNALTCALRDASRRGDGTSAITELNHERDFPHIIGTSASTNIAYLVSTYGLLLDPASFQRCFVKAAAWNLNPHRDPIRRAEAETTVRTCNGAWMLDEPRFQQLLAQTDERAVEDTPANVALVDALSGGFAFDSTEQTGRALLDVYYVYMHGYFAAIARGEGHLVAAEVYGDPDRPAIAPLRGVGLACALARGLLADCPNEAVALAEQQAGRRATESERGALAQAAINFGKAPALVALVTSSGYYEARTILTEVFRGLRVEVAHWPVPASVQERIKAAFASPEQFYDAIITADESHEIRLKPFRDLYTIAARTLGLDQVALRNTVGFEDTWAGVTAMRCAGIGIPCAVPFEGSRSHDFSLAAHVFEGGISEAILTHALFAQPRASVH